MDHGEIELNYKTDELVDASERGTTKRGGRREGGKRDESSYREFVENADITKR
jgi:hypothetical protein